MINAEWNLTEDFPSVEAFSFLILASTCGAPTITPHSFVRQRRVHQWMGRLAVGKNGVSMGTVSQLAKILPEVTVLNTMHWQVDGEAGVGGVYAQEHVEGE